MPTVSVRDSEVWVAPPVPQVLVVGVNHHTAPVFLRQRVALAGEAADAALAHLKEAGIPAVVLSTCNRTEVYAAAPDSGWAWHQLDSFLCLRLGLTTREIMAHVYGYEGERAAHHLYRVACGLDSMVVGEAQILGQVRAAIERAEAAGAAGPYLSRLFRKSLATARWVRVTTGLGRGAASVGTAVVALTERELGGIGNRHALIVGAGHTGRLVARAMAKAGVASISVVNRSPEKAKELAEWLGGKALPWAHLERAISSADIVVSCTSAPDIVLDRPLVERAMRGRNGRPLLLIDIAVPRDIAAEAREVPGVRLYDIDQLCPDARTLAPEDQVAQAETLVKDEVARFMAWLRSRQVVPTIQALRQRAEAARQQELAECLRRIPHLGGQERTVLEQMTAALVNKLLHGPLVYLKQAPAPATAAEVVAGLFQMETHKAHGES